jgi:hypothetical protein
MLSTPTQSTHHGHLEVASRQDVEDAIILALAPVFASLFRSKLKDQVRLREATAELACLYVSRKRAHLMLRMLRETNGMKEAGLGVVDLPLLAKSIRIVKDDFTITRNHVAHSEIAHEADAVNKVFAPTLLDQDRNKVLVRLDLDTLATAQVNVKCQTHAACQWAACARRRIPRTHSASHNRACRLCRARHGGLR